MVACRIDFDVLATPDNIKKLVKKFGLRAAEATMALLLAEGLTIRQAAERLHYSEGAARMASKRAYDATRVHSQAQLVRVVFISLLEDQK